MDEEEEEARGIDMLNIGITSLLSVACVSLLAFLLNLSFSKVRAESKYGPPQRAEAEFKKEKSFKNS